jgi:hypothetical protein
MAQKRIEIRTEVGRPFRLHAEGLARRERDTGQAVADTFVDGPNDVVVPDVIVGAERDSLLLRKRRHNALANGFRRMSFAGGAGRARSRPTIAELRLRGNNLAA